MSSGSGRQAGSPAYEARREYEAQRERFAAERERLLLARATPGYLDLGILSALVCGALAAAMWLLGTAPTHGRFSAMMLLGGLLGSGCPALVSVGRPSPLGSRWLWRAAALSGAPAALSVFALFGGDGMLDVVPETQGDRLLIGFAAGVATWRALRPARLVSVSAPEPLAWR
jgi:hypothetical protein